MFAWAWLSTCHVTRPGNGRCARRTVGQLGPVRFWVNGRVRAGCRGWPLTCYRQAGARVRLGARSKGLRTDSRWGRRPACTSRYTEIGWAGFNPHHEVWCLLRRIRDRFTWSLTEWRKWRRHCCPWSVRVWCQQMEQRSKHGVTHL